MELKKLYALFVILIVIYIGINIGVNGFNIVEVSDDTADAADSDTIDITSSGGFPDLDNFTQNKINDTAVSYLDNSTGTNIEVQQISDSENVSNIFDSASNGGSYTSSQKIDQNGVTAYFLYNEGSETYNTDIYFNKNSHNYKISGYNTTYENSDYFIDHCKQIIDTI